MSGGKEASSCLNEAVMNIISERNPWLERRFFFFLIVLSPQQVSEIKPPQQPRVGPNLNQIKWKNYTASKGIHFHFERTTTLLDVSV